MKELEEAIKNLTVYACGLHPKTSVVPLRLAIDEIKAFKKDVVCIKLTDLQRQLKHYELQDSPIAAYIEELLGDAP